MDSSAFEYRHPLLDPEQRFVGANLRQQESRPAAVARVRCEQLGQGRIGRGRQAPALAQPTGETMMFNRSGARGDGSAGDQRQASCHTTHNVLVLLLFLSLASCARVNGATRLVVGQSEKLTCWIPCDSTLVLGCVERKSPVAMTMPLLDQVIFEIVVSSEEEVERQLDCDLLYYYGELRRGHVVHFRAAVEKLAERDDKKKVLGICLTTPGGEAEAVEKMVEIARHHYSQLYAVVPSAAMSAGTILCMACDKIFMDYSSSLGPIDPQVSDREQKYLVPALGYLDKVAELIEKSRDGSISPAEFALLQAQDLAMIRFYEQAKELSINLLRQWLTRYKFKDWSKHRTTNPGTKVTKQEKEQRAEAIAKLLSDNNHWHSHGRMIGMKTLRDVMRLDIDDFGKIPDLRDAIRRYSDTLTDYLARANAPFYLYNRSI
jgi:hypothetical protein